MPTASLRRLYFAAPVHPHPALHSVVEEYGAAHPLMGPPSPADMGETDPVGFIEGAARLDDATRRAILGENAARLLGLEIPRRAGQVPALPFRAGREFRNVHTAGDDRPDSARNCVFSWIVLLIADFR